MSERRDDTTESPGGSPPERERLPGSYYYDDGTGYELYDPAADDAEGVETGDESGGEVQDAVGLRPERQRHEPLRSA